MRLVPEFSSSLEKMLKEGVIKYVRAKIISKEECYAINVDMP